MSECSKHFSNYCKTIKFRGDKCSLIRPCKRFRLFNFHYLMAVLFNIINRVKLLQAFNFHGFAHQWKLRKLIAGEFFQFYSIYHLAQVPVPLLNTTEASQNKIQYVYIVAQLQVKSSFHLEERRIMDGLELFKAIYSLTHQPVPMLNSTNPFLNQEHPTKLFCKNIYSVAIVSWLAKYAEQITICNPYIYM